MKNILVTALALVVASCAVPEKKTELAAETASVEAPTELGAPAPNVCMYSAAARTTRNCYWNDCGDCGGDVGRGQTWKQVWTQVPWTCNTVTPKGWERTPVNPPYRQGQPQTSISIAAWLETARETVRRAMTVAPPI